MLPIILISLPMFFGCAESIPSTNLIPTNLGNKSLIYNGPLYKAIEVDKVGGGSKPNLMGSPNIGTPELRQAIIQSLANNNYLSLNNENGDYTLNVFLIDIDRPRGGFTMTVTTFVKYQVINDDNKNVIYDEIIDATDTKKFSDSFFGPTRLRITEEDSMKKNINKFIEQLFLLNKEL